MVAQATLLLFGSFFVMLLAGVPISAGIGIASIFTALFSMDPAIFALTAAQRCFSGIPAAISNALMSVSSNRYVILLIMNLGIGSVTPPVGSCLFVGCGVGKVKIEGVTKYIVPLFVSMVVALFLVTFIPAISLVVPYLCGLVPGLGWTM